jgi:hypothetical protein
MADDGRAVASVRRSELSVARQTAFQPRSVDYRPSTYEVRAAVDCRQPSRVVVVLSSGTLSFHPTSDDRAQGRIVCILL